MFMRVRAEVMKQTGQAVPPKSLAGGAFYFNGFGWIVATTAGRHQLVAPLLNPATRFNQEQFRPEDFSAYLRKYRAGTDLARIRLRILPKL
jgi:hypothetical protein